MSNIIQIESRNVGDTAVQTVNARELHEFLEVGRDFSSWIKARIEQYDFVEQQDFVIIDSAPQNGGAGNRGHRIEYAISLDMAKELSMVERNEKGKEARRYFIECERRAKDSGNAIASKRPTTISRNQVAASILLLRSAAEDLKFAPSAVLGGYQRLEAQLGVTGLLPGYAVDSANTSSGSSDETRAASELLEKFNVGMGAAAFNRLLMQHGILEERERASSNGGTKKFKVCVNLAYGKNLTSPSNPRETQPHWYVSTFQELVDLVMPVKQVAA